MTAPGPTATGRGGRPVPRKPAPTAPPAVGRGGRAQARPAAPVRPNTPTNQPTQRCPLESMPCDVQKLTVRALILGPSGKDRILKATKHLRGQPISKPVSREVRALLNRYDLMIDVVAGYPSKEDSSPDNKVRIQGFAEYHGTTCSRQQHPLIALLPRNTIEEFRATPGGLKWHAKQTEPREFMARSLGRDTQQHDNKLGAIFDVLTSMWPGAYQKHLAVLAIGCGRRAPGGGVPVGELAALIRIFRSDTWSIVLKIPPLGKYTHTREGTRNLQTGAVTSTSKSAATGPGNRLLPEKIRKPSRLSLTIKRNAREVSGIGVEEVIDTILKIAEIIKDGFEALKRLPQLGWKIAFSISVLEGSIEGQWGPRMIDAPIDNRYLPVETFFTLKINVTLLSVSVDLSFGLEAMALGTGVNLKLSGTISCKVPLTVNVVSSHENFEVKLAPDIKCELKVVAYASVLGLSIIDVQVSVTGGITVDGKFVVDTQRGLHLAGSVKRKPIVVKGHIKWPKGPPKPFTPIVALAGAEICKL